MEKIELSELILSTSTIEGSITNIKFSEKEIIDKLYLTDDIIKIGCNYGEYISDIYNELSQKSKKTNRGRKPKEKKTKNRKKQGTGNYFNSQITFTLLLNKELKQIYHCKMFTNGTIQSPGVLKEDLSLLDNPLTKFCKYLENIDEIKIDIEKPIIYKNIHSIMRNYKCKNLDEKKKINLKELFILINNLLKLEDKTELEINDIKNEKKINLIEIKYNPERYPGNLIRFSTPFENKKDKKTTIKLFGSLKTNLDGANNIYEANLIKEWLENFINKNYNELIYIQEE